jgi:hypothetical protein
MVAIIAWGWGVVSEIGRQILLATCKKEIYVLVANHYPGFMS